MDIKGALLRGLKSGLNTYLLLAKLVVPVYILIPILKATPLFPPMEEVGRPLVMMMNLPGEAALVLITGFFNFYSALALLASLSFTKEQVTIIGTMLIIAHSLLVEAALLKKFHLPFFLMVFSRIILALLAGILVGHFIL